MIKPPTQVVCLLARRVFLAVIAAPITLLAATSWTGAVNNDFSNAANWSNGLPGPANAAIVSLTGDKSPVLTGGNYSLSNLSIGDGPKSGSLTVTGGAVVTANTAVGSINGQGTSSLTISGNGTRLICPASLLVGNFDSFFLPSVNTQINISDGAELETLQVSYGGSPFDQTVVNIGAPALSPAVAPGTLRINYTADPIGIFVNIFPPWEEVPFPEMFTIQFNHTSDALVFNQMLSGGVGITHTAGTTIFSGINYGYGPVVINGGTVTPTNPTALGGASVENLYSYFGGDITLNGGTLDLKADKPLKLDTRAGNFTMTGGTLRMNIDSPSSHDQITSSIRFINKATTCSIQGGTLDLTGSSLQTGNYTIVSGFASTSGNFTSITGFDAALFSVSFSASGGNGILRVTANPPPTPSPSPTSPPEPTPSPSPSPTSTPEPTPSPSPSPSSTPEPPPTPSPSPSSTPEPPPTPSPSPTSTPEPPPTPSPSPTSTPEPPPTPSPSPSSTPEPTPTPSPSPSSTPEPPPTPSPSPSSTPEPTPSPSVSPSPSASPNPSASPSPSRKPTLQLGKRGVTDGKFSTRDSSFVLPGTSNNVDLVFWRFIGEDKFRSFPVKRNDWTVRITGLKPGNNFLRFYGLNSETQEKTKTANGNIVRSKK